MLVIRFLDEKGQLCIVHADSQVLEDNICYEVEFSECKSSNKPNAKNGTGLV
jgi:hypothetical protein